MEQIGGLLNRQFQRPKANKRINPLWEQAQEFGQAVGLKTSFVLKCFKMFGKNKVLLERSFLRDAIGDEKKKPGLLLWKLRQ